MTHDEMTREQAAREETSIRAFFDRYADLFMTHQGDAWMDLWDENGVQLPPNDSMHVGKESIRRANWDYINDPSRSFEFTITTQEVILFESGHALARGVYKMTTSTERGDSSIMDGKFMSVLKKQSDGRWLLFRDCFNSNIPVL